MLGALALGVWLFGCEEPTPPLQVERTQLASLDRVPMAPGWAPQATLVLSQGQIQKLVTRFAVQAAPKAPTITVDGGPVSLSAKVKPEPPRVALSASDRCGDCVALHGEGTGALTLSAGTLGGDLRWRSQVDAVARVEGTPRPAGFDVTVVPVERESWTVGLDVRGLPPIYGGLIEAALARQIEVGIREAGPLAHPIPVATLPYDGLVRLRGLRSRYVGGVGVDLAFSTLQAGTVHEAPDPGPGFAVRVPSGTLAGIAHAALVRMGPVEGVQPEVTALHLDDGRFELWMKIWKVARREVWREYVLRGEVRLEDGLVRILPEDAHEVGQKAWRTPLEPVVQAVVVDTLKKTLAVDAPGRYLQPIGDGSAALIVTLQRLQADEDALTVWGTID